MRNPLTREWRHQYVNRLKKLGLEHIGDGFNADVFQHPTMPDVAVKVVDAVDRQHFNFTRWSMKHSWNPWVPKFHSIQMIDVVNSTAYGIIFTERLDRIGGYEYTQFTRDFFDTDPEFLCVDSVREALHQVDSDDLRTLLNFLLRKPHSLDLHQENFMKRGDQIVFVDPWSGN
jgi:hypothetical protein